MIKHFKIYFYFLMNKVNSQIIYIFNIQPKMITQVQGNHEDKTYCNLILHKGYFFVCIT